MPANAPPASDAADQQGGAWTTVRGKTSGRSHARAVRGPARDVGPPSAAARPGRPGPVAKTLTFSPISTLGLLRVEGPIDWMAWKQPPRELVCFPGVNTVLFRLQPGVAPDAVCLAVGNVLGNCFLAAEICNRHNAVVLRFVKESDAETISGQSLNVDGIELTPMIAIGGPGSIARIKARYEIRPNPQVVTTHLHTAFNKFGKILDIVMLTEGGIVSTTAYVILERPADAALIPSVIIQDGYQIDVRVETETESFKYCKTEGRRSFL
ncbi:hypothetical protein H4R21_000871 [Coemansia helicoidea]|uniref:Uncharacterized protein n=1 Tax=Coemansia helicoidea TaxID=1286919 RepID=A0ACC1LF10_9FUNG|nr:hypothetical protein H4R21_000871 [Coemansia helicoidea]